MQADAKAVDTADDELVTLKTMLRCHYAQTNLSWNGSILSGTENLLHERFVIASPFRKQINSCLTVGVVDQFKPLFGLKKLGVHVVPSEVQRELSRSVVASVQATTGPIGDRRSPDSRTSSSTPETEMCSESSSLDWTASSTSTYAVIARRPLPERYEDVELSQYLKDTRDLSSDVRRQLCNTLCFRWLLGNPIRRLGENSKVFVRAVDAGIAATVMEVHQTVVDSHEHYFDESTTWDSFSSSLSYRLFVLNPNPASQRIGAALTLAQKCVLQKIRNDYLTSLLESICPIDDRWSMSRLVFEWRKRIEHSCTSIHSSTLWIGNFVMRRITQHLHSVDYNADLIDEP